MARIVAVSVLRALVVFVIVTFLTFALVYGDGPGTARAVLGFQAQPAEVQAEVVKLGLDRPLLTQYGDWLSGFVRGDMGTSFFSNQPVTSTLQTRVPVTLSLVLITVVLTVVLSVVLGITAAVRGGWQDRAIQIVSVGGAAIPSFIVAIALVFALAIGLRVFPATGYVPLSEDPWGWLTSLTLPVIALLVGSVANAAAQFRGAVRDVLEQDFVRTLRARGMPERQVVYRHVLRNAAGPGLTVLSLQTIAMIGGVVIIEQVFALPGIGALATAAALQGDIPVVMGCVAVVVVFVSIINLVGDLSTAALNPKTRQT